MAEHKCPFCGSSEWEWIPINSEGDTAATCSECDRAFGWDCQSCGDPWEGTVYQDDYECDWINFGHNPVICPECGGEGVDWLTPAAAKEVLQREKEYYEAFDKEQIQKAYRDETEIDE